MTAKALCNREPQFAELYEALGDRSRQDLIRAENPGEHCRILLRNPSGCRGCPNNPYENGTFKEVSVEEVVDPNEALAPVIWLHECVQAGWLDPRQLPADEAFAVRLLEREMEQHHEQLQAKLIAAELAQVLAKMFA